MARRIAAAILITSLAMLPLATGVGNAAGGGPVPILGLEIEAPVAADPNTIIVTFEHDQADPGRAATAAVERAAEVVAGAGITRVTPITGRTVSVTLDTTINRAESARIGYEVEARSGVAAAEPAATFTPSTTNDPDYSYLWNLTPQLGSAYSVNAEGAWATTTGSGSVVGVIDTGITAHTDLTGSSTATIGGNVLAGYDFITDPTASGDGDGRDSNPADAGDYCNGSDSSWHGTHVAGIIAAIRDNSTGAVGVAPGAKVQPLRALGRCGGSETDIIAAIRWGAGLSVIGTTANPTPVDVLNLSLGSPSSCSFAMQSAINAAVAKGVTVVASAGNSTAALAMPANCANVISVTATGYSGQPTYYSNFGTPLSPATIAAPGGAAVSGTDLRDYVFSTWNSGTTGRGTEAYGGMAGTSMSAPHVAAAAAMVKAVNRDDTPAHIRQLLTDSATPIPGCAIAKCGAGVVNIAAAVSQAATEAAGGLSLPTVTGTARVGATLSASVVAVGSSPLTYQWLRNADPIPGATASSYTATATDYNANLAVAITATIAGATVSRSSPPSLVAAGTFSQTRSPATSGSYRYRHTLKAAKGAWSPSAATITYHWLRNGAPIRSATKSKYKLKKADRRKFISVRVTVASPGYSTTSAVSARHRVR